MRINIGGCGRIYLTTHGMPMWPPANQAAPTQAKQIANGPYPSLATRRLNELARRLDAPIPNLLELARRRVGLARLGFEPPSF